MIGDRFTGDEPTDLASIRAATRTRCGCGPPTTTTTTTLPTGVNGCDPEDFIDRTADAADRTITAQNFAFVPRCIKVRLGQAVTFDNASAAAHSVSGERVGAPGDDFTASLPIGGQATRQLSPAGTWGYDCNVHPNEQGAILVVP